MTTTTTQRQPCRSTAHRQQTRTVLREWQEVAETAVQGRWGRRARSGAQGSLIRPALARSPACCRRSYSAPRSRCRRSCAGACARVRAAASHSYTCSRTLLLPVVMHCCCLPQPMYVFVVVTRLYASYALTLQVRSLQSSAAGVQHTLSCKGICKCIRCPGGGASGSIMLEGLMERLSFRGKPKIADLTSSRKLADKVRAAVHCAPTKACMRCCSSGILGHEECILDSNACSLCAMPVKWAAKLIPLPEGFSHWLANVLGKHQTGTPHLRACLALPGNALPLKSIHSCMRFMRSFLKLELELQYTCRE